MSVNWWILTDNRFIRPYMKYLYFPISQLARFGFRFSNSILYRAEIAEILDRDKPPPANVTIQVLDPDDRQTSLMLRKRYGLKTGGSARSTVLLALQDSEVIGYVCSSGSISFVEEIDREETFKDGIYLFSALTLPPARQRGIMKLLVINAVKHAEKQGKHQFAYAYVLTNNLASRRFCESLGFEALRVIHYLRVFGLKSYQVEGPPEPLKEANRSSGDHLARR